MTVRSRQEIEMNKMIASEGRIDVGIGDGMSAAMEDAWRTGPTMAITRAAKSIFDTSEKMTPEEANEKFGLTGTEAEVKPDEEITFEAANDRANDFHDLRMNEIITETVNEESPIMGNVTQFAASMAASMVDPTLIAANMAGAGLVGAGFKALNTSVKGFNTVAKYSPAAAKALLGAYADDAVRSLTTVVAREGLENVVGSVLEEGIIQFGMSIGDDRMARKYTMGDSLQNLIAGTVMGTGLGTIINKDGRKAIADGYLMDWGDSAEDFVKANNHIASLEAASGHAKGRLEVNMANLTTFGSRPWYSEADVKFTPSVVPTKVYIPVNADGTVHTVSHRGNGTVLTGSKHHAMNVGEKVIEIHTDKLRLATPETKLSANLGKTLATELVNNTNPEKLSRALAILADSEVKLEEVTTASMKELTKTINEMFQGKSLDQIADIVSALKSRSESKFDMHPTIEKALDAEGYHGYTFAGKDFDGKPAYTGVYVSEKYGKRLQKGVTLDKPQPTPGDKVKWQFEQEQVYRKHKDWVKKEAKPLKSGIEEIQELVGLKKETPLDETAPKVKDHNGEALASSKEKVSLLNRTKEALKAKLEKQKTDGVDIDPEMEKSLEILEAVEQGIDEKTLLEKDFDSWDKYTSCILGVMKGTT